MGKQFVSKVSHDFKALVGTLDDRQLERKVKDMRDACARLQVEADFASRELRSRRKASLKRARDEP